MLTQKISIRVMVKILVNYKKLRFLLGLRFISPKTSLETEDKKGFFKSNRLRFSKQEKGIIVFAIIVILLLSFFTFLPRANQSTPSPQPTDSPIASPSDTPQETTNPTHKPNIGSQISNILTGISDGITQVFTPPKAPGTIESAETMNSTVWRAVAANAWQYFQPGIGVDPNTGLPRNGGTDSTTFTDWDLGVYIQAVIDAQKIGLIGTDGDWNSSARLETVVKFLETRELNETTHYPYWFYQAVDGKDYHKNSDLATSTVDGVDTGRLFVALNNLRNFNSSLAPRINDIVLNKGPYHNRSDYSVLVPAIKAESLYSTSIYAYYVASGFASFWPNELSNATSTILNNIRVRGTTTTSENVTLPLADILGDPLYCSVFETSNSSQLMVIAQQVYLAHEAYYNATLQATGQGQYRAFSEGSSLSTHWAYEWVVLSDGRTWVVLDEQYHDYNISPMIYTKIAMSFLAIYNTTYAHDMVVYLERTLPDPINGYSEGVDESGAQLTGVGLNTNGMIIGAAKYAIQNNP